MCLDLAIEQKLPNQYQLDSVSVRCCQGQLKGERVGGPTSEIR